MSPVKSKFLSLNFSAIFWSRRYLVLTITSIVGSVALVLGLLFGNPWSTVINLAFVREYVSPVDVVSRFDLEFARDYPNARLKVYDSLNVIQIRVDGNSSSVVRSEASSLKNLIIKIASEQIESQSRMASLEYENLIFNIKSLFYNDNIKKELFKEYFSNFTKLSNKATVYNELIKTQNFLSWSNNNVDVRKEWLPYSVLAFFVLSSVASFIISIVILGLLELKKKKKR